MNEILTQEKSIYKQIKEMIENDILRDILMEEQQRVSDRYNESMIGKTVTVLVEKASGGKFGARDLRRTIRKQVEDPLAERLVDGTLGLDVTVDAQDGQIVLR